MQLNVKIFFRDVTFNDVTFKLENINSNVRKRNELLKVIEEAIVLRPEEKECFPGVLYQGKKYLIDKSMRKFAKFSLTIIKMEDWKKNILYLLYDKHRITASYFWNSLQLDQTIPNKEFSILYSLNYEGKRYKKLYLNKEGIWINSKKKEARINEIIKTGRKNYKFKPTICTHSTDDGITKITIYQFTEKKIISYICKNMKETRNSQERKTLFECIERIFSLNRQKYFSLEIVEDRLYPHPIYPNKWASFSHSIIPFEGFYVLYHPNHFSKMPNCDIEQKMENIDIIYPDNELKSMKSIDKNEYYLLIKSGELTSEEETIGDIIKEDRKKRKFKPVINISFQYKDGRSKTYIEFYYLLKRKKCEFSSVLECSNDNTYYKNAILDLPLRYIGRFNCEINNLLKTNEAQRLSFLKMLQNMFYSMPNNKKILRKNKIYMCHIVNSEKSYASFDRDIIQMRACNGGALLYLFVGERKHDVNVIDEKGTIFNGAFYLRKTELKIVDPNHIKRFKINQNEINRHFKVFNRLASPYTNTLFIEENNTITAYQLLNHFTTTTKSLSKFISLYKRRMPFICLIYFMMQALKILEQSLVNKIVHGNLTLDKIRFAFDTNKKIIVSFVTRLDNPALIVDKSETPSKNISGKDDVFSLGMCFLKLFCIWIDDNCHRGKAYTPILLDRKQQLTLINKIYDCIKDDITEGDDWGKKIKSDEEWNKRIGKKIFYSRTGDKWWLRRENFPIFRVRKEWLDKVVKILKAMLAPENKKISASDAYNELEKSLGKNTICRAEKFLAEKFKL